jgi:hypothetical protein
MNFQLLIQQTNKQIQKLYCHMNCDLWQNKYMKLLIEETRLIHV